MHAQGLRFEHVQTHPQGEFGIKLPMHTTISPALALAMRHLAAGQAELDFLPPKISAWEQFTSKYSSPRLVTAGAAAGAVAAIVVLAFFVEQCFLWYWGHRWHSIEKRVYALEDTTANIRKFRPFYDASHRELAILRRLTESFPEDGSVSAKQIEIRDPNKPGERVTVTCTGSAMSRSGLLRLKEKLAQVRNVSNVHTEMERGSSPMEFTFNFQWSEGQ